MLVNWCASEERNRKKFCFYIRWNRSEFLTSNSVVDLSELDCIGFISTIKYFENIEFYHYEFSYVYMKVIVLAQLDWLWFGQKEKKMNQCVFKLNEYHF